jgi:hypothetical protein
MKQETKKIRRFAFYGKNYTTRVSYDLYSIEKTVESFNNSESIKHKTKTLDTNLIGDSNKA